MAKRKIDDRSQLAKALDFLSLTFKAGEDQGLYAMIGNHEARSFNSIIAAGTTVEEDLQACPQIDLMAAAVAQCGHEYVITQMSDSKLCVRSGDFRAFVPCLDPSRLSWPIPDAEIAPIDDSLLVALKKVAPLLSATGQTLIEQSIQLNGGSCLSTNRTVVLEAWHGFDLPDGILLPKAIVTGLNKAKKTLRGFGVSDKTATFYFDDDTWLRSQRFQGKWPEIKAHLMRGPVPPLPVPPQLFECVEKIAPFSPDGFIHIKQGMMSSHDDETEQLGSALRLPIGSEHATRSYRVDDLKRIASHVLTWDEHFKEDGTYFEGSGIRGLIYHRSERDVNSGIGPTDDEEIPF